MKAKMSRAQRAAINALSRRMAELVNEMGRTHSIALALAALGSYAADAIVSNFAPGRDRELELESFIMTLRKRVAELSRQ